MATATLNQALTLFGQLSGEDQELMLEIARKRRIEAWRKETAAYAKKGLRDHRAGKLPTVSVAELPAYLNQLWEESDA